MRHVADVVRTDFASEHRNDRRLIEYGRRLGNQTVFKGGALTPVNPVEFWPTAPISATPLVRRQSSSAPRPRPPSSTPRRARKPTYGT